MYQLPFWILPLNLTVLRNLTPCLFIFFLFKEEKHKYQVPLRGKSRSRGVFLLYFSLPSSSFPLATPKHVRLEKQH